MLLVVVEVVDVVVVVRMGVKSGKREKSGKSEEKWTSEESDGASESAVVCVQMGRAAFSMAPLNKPSPTHPSMKLLSRPTHHNHQ